MVAGAASGILEHCVMYPIDSVKTRMQILTPDPRAKYKGMMDAFRSIARNESMWVTMRGIDVTAYGAGPAHAVYFACYEHIKKCLRRTDGSNHLVHAVAGIGATIAHDIVYNPFEVMKQRMQVYGSPYRSWVACLSSVLKTEGWMAFYRSFGTQLIMNAPYQSLHFVVYEFVQDRLNPDRNYKPLTHVLSGGAAGAVAAAATTPFDVMKTLLNTYQQRAKIGIPRAPANLPENSSESPEQRKLVRGISGAAKEVYRLGGIRGFFAGTVPRVLYQIPSTAIAWSTYEFFKFAIITYGSSGTS